MKRDAVLILLGASLAMTGTMAKLNPPLAIAAFLISLCLSALAQAMKP